MSQEKKKYTFQGSHINMIKTEQNLHYLSHKLVQYCVDHEKLNPSCNTFIQQRI